MVRQHWSCWDLDDTTEEPEEPVIEPVEEKQCYGWGCACWGTPSWGCFEESKSTPYPPRIDEVMIIPHTLVEVHVMRG